MENLAKLAMLDVKYAEELKRDIDNMLNMAKVLDEIECESFMPDKEGFLREDKAEASFDREKLLCNAPERKNDAFVVPKTVR